MEKKLQDYIQYYLHCDFYLTKRNIRTRITNYWPRQDKEHCIGYGLDDVNGVEDIHYIKPILRKLDSLTDEEIKGLINWDKIRAIYKNVSFERCINGIVVYYAIDAGHDHGGLFPHTYKITFHSFSPFEWRFLLSIGIDLFNLIKDGLAIDASTLTK